MRAARGLLVVLLLAAGCGGSTGIDQSAKHFSIGLFHVGIDHIPPSLPALVNRLQKLGYLSPAESQQFVNGLSSIPRSLDENGARLRLEWRNLPNEAAADEAAKQFVKDRLDLIVAFESQTIRAAHAATSTAPVLFLHALDPVKEGLVSSLAHPGTNMTGLIGFRRLGGKQLEMFKNLMPDLKRVLAIGSREDPASPGQMTDIRTTAATLHISVVERSASNKKELQGLFNGLKSGGVDGVVIASQDLQTKFSYLIINLATAHRLPVSVGLRQRVEAGGLFSYAANFPAVGTAAAAYVDKILRGARPSDLPVEEMTQLQLIVNQKVAQELGISLSPQWLDAADEVINRITPVAA